MDAPLTKEVKSEGAARWETGPAESKVPQGVGIVLVLLGVLLVAMGLASAWAFNRVDHLYTGLVRQTARDLDDVHDISYHAGVGYSSLMALAFTHDPGKRAALLDEMRFERGANDKVIEDLGGTGLDAVCRAARENMVQKRQLSRLAAEAFTEVELKGGDLAPAAEHLREAYVAYQGAADQLSTLIVQRSLVANANVEQNVHQLKSLFFVAGILPLVIGLGLVVLSAYLIWSTPPEMDLQ